MAQLLFYPASEYEYSPLLSSILTQEASSVFESVQGNIFQVVFCLQ